MCRPPAMLRAAPLLLLLALRCADPAPGRSPGPPCAPRAQARSPPATVRLQSDLFDEEELVAGLPYKVVVSRTEEGPPIAFALASTIEEVPAGKFREGRDKCGPNYFNSQLEGQQQLTINWTLEDNPTVDSNVTFELIYRLEDDTNFYSWLFQFPISQECHLHLKPKESQVTSQDLPAADECHLWFPQHGPTHSLVVDLLRLNVPCSRGYLHFLGLNASQQLRSHRQSHLCGKLEELPQVDRRLYFPPSHLPPVVRLRGRPVFTLSYHLVDYCHNVTFLAANGSFELRPTAELKCTFKIYLPYGNRVALTLHVGDGTTTGPPATDALARHRASDAPCDGLQTLVRDGAATWSHCARSGDAARRVDVLSRENRVVLAVSARRGGVAMRMTYSAAPVAEIAGGCGFGWVALKRFCVAAVEEVRLPWRQAEMECARRGGHLASVRTERDMNVVNAMLMNSPGYRNNNAYWIGATDKIAEGDFRWSDGLPFSYSYWFPGWSQHGYYNRQPNDDGLSEQDCVELRRTYSLPTSAQSLAENFMWNDRDCSTPNYFICERLQNDEPLDEDKWPLECNRSVELSRQQPRAAVSSPGFPRHYPDNTDCDVDVSAPAGYRLVLDFEELVLEDEPSCSYDYLEILESRNNVTWSLNSSSARRLCGDWSSKLKLLRYVSKGSKLKLRFSSDYSHHFGGFKARVSMENPLQCSDDRLHLFNNSCYLFVSYPEVNWHTAQQICTGNRALLASVLSAEEERFVTATIRKASDYRTSAIYWLGGKVGAEGNLEWVDGSAVTYAGWVPGAEALDGCLSVQWMAAPAPQLPSGLYWRGHRCDAMGGFVCKREESLKSNEEDLNRTVNGTNGTITSPRYPENYHDNLDYSVKILGPDRTRIVVKFIKIDIEPQQECLYDFVELRSADSKDAVRFCGVHDTQMERFNFVSEGNEVNLNFHSDYSITGSGFSLIWNAVDVSACPLQTLTAKEGVLTSPNYPDFILAHLNCSITILAPLGKRIWLDFQTHDLRAPHAALLLDIDPNQSPLHPFTTSALLTEGTFVSAGHTLRLLLSTGSGASGRGFRALYRILDAVVEQKTIALRRDAVGALRHLNYPASPPANVDFLQHLVAPLGCVVTVEVVGMRPAGPAECEGGGEIEVVDRYYDDNGTVWRLCPDPAATTPIAVTSFLNSLRLRQKGGNGGAALNGSLRVQVDEDFRAKLLRHSDDGVESCSPDPCLNGGKCVSGKEGKKFCQCTGHFTGLFCALTKCDLDPCVFGTCHLTNTSYRCQCRGGYTGPVCDQKRKPCAGNPCESRGLCVERGDGFVCKCHAWWEGPRCEKRMLHIPYKPLSERMFHEPFWLGLMTVFIVMAVIGLVWCAKRHFPEKIEKLLAEESERNRSTRTPSPKKKRNNSTPTKKNAAVEKKQILQQLVSPAANRQLSRKVSLGELMQLSERCRSKEDGGDGTATTHFGGDVLLDPKLEKKVTFARLLSRVSAEMSSGSELEAARPSSTPPSPRTDVRSPNSTSSNQGSDSFAGSDLAIPTALSVSDLLGRGGGKKPTSADSILAMFRNFSSSSAAVNLPPSLRVSPSTTPTASSPQDDVVGDDDSSTSPVSFASAPPDSPVRTIEVPVLDPLGAHRSAAAAAANLLHPPTILLEIPGTINKCLSPIREMPTPLPSPALTPVMRRRGRDSEEEDEEVAQEMAIDPQAEDGLILEEAKAMQQGACGGFKVKNRPPPLPQYPTITVSSPTSQPPVVIPTLVVQTPSPTHSPSPSIPGSPPPHRHATFQFPPPLKQNKKFCKDPDKPNSLDLPCAPPLITVTCNMSEAESDAEGTSPAAPKTAAPGMAYLSPFAMGANAASESNLSSSGYSSMASPGPSRCGSSNPLCGSEMEDQGGPGTGAVHRRPSPVLKTNVSDRGGQDKGTEEQRRGRSDSETLSDDPLLESNDEGIGTDHIDEKIEEGDVKSAKELEVFMSNEVESSKAHGMSISYALQSSSTELARKNLDDIVERLAPPPPTRKSLQLPSIVVQCDPPVDKLLTTELLSPLSSRSESPLSDRTSRFSPHFYGRHKDLLPFTDSDGLYDFPSSDKMDALATHKKTSGRRREKKRKTASPTKSFDPLFDHLDVPGCKTAPPPRKHSPKRRITRSHVVSSSSSSDSIASARELRLSSSSPETMRWSSPVEWLEEGCKKKEVEEFENIAVPRAVESSKHQKISKLRAISHQIRFLRRLELSLKRRERTISPSDSLDSGGDDDSPRATSPLLSKSPRVEIRKSSSIGKLHNNQKTNRGKYKRGELLLPQEERSWKSVVATGNGHSD